MKKLIGPLLILCLLCAACQPVSPDPVLEESSDGQPSPQPIITTIVPTADVGGSAVSPDDLQVTDSAGPVDPVLEEFITDATNDLASRFGITSDAIEVVSAESVDWPDSALGCPAEDEVAAQVITSGYRILLRAGGVDYEYHTALDWMRFCENLP